ncbi:phage integrase SAM-like domain-containing protein [Culturomica massiliensis]|jgi:hypothetical protein|uniref:phage integrase SAM-like domain-containing protein n=1 Tax=Culturomica massiliensis TaxID=1841857 RepID=UPI000E55ABAA|nr:MULTISPECIES: phage integrase SAM-like domain-containing protein [Odoribacteraceae]RHV95278.1 hypothetical protein DXA95_07280 [Odoribacter sp. OF09-27XD]
MSKNVSQAFDKLLLHLSQIERERNGQIIAGSPNERKFRYVRDCLCNFTQTIMKQDFSTLTFDDIDRCFLQKYVNHLNERNVENKLQKLRRVFREANVDTSFFDCIKIPAKLESDFLMVDHKVIEKIESMNRAKLTEKEELYIDLFLFGYYTGGSTINEMASLKVSSIKNGYLYCRRNASENIAVIPLCSDALHIIDKYQSMCFDDYLLPIFTHKHNSPEQQLGRIKRISELTNQTLRRVSKMLKLENVITMGMTKWIFIEHLLLNEVPYEKVAQYLGCSIETVLRYSEKMRQNYGE